MKAKLITYITEGFSPTKRSILSKRINGYVDKSNRSRYTYKRKGVFAGLPHIKVTDKAFIIPRDDFDLVCKAIKKYGAKIKAWDIEIEKF
jgi:hypothetical protein